MAVAALRPGFWLQHASNEARQLVAFADELATTPSGRPGVAFGPVNVPGTLNSLFEQARAAGDAILDPHGHLLDDRPHTQRRRDHFPWLTLTPRPATQTQWEAWMQRGLDHQRSSDLRGSGPAPSFVMTPSPVIEAAHGTLELYAVLDAAGAVQAQLSAPSDCWFGVSVDRTYLREQSHLTPLANTMLASPAPGFVFRASHPHLAPVDDHRYLSGLREIVQAMSGNGIPVLLPNAGWLGWLAMGWGAWAFTGGMAAGTWVDRVPGPMTRPKRPAEPYFESQLLRTVPWRVHEQLVQEPAYQPCACPECILMGGTHDGALAKRHQIRQANDEAAALISLAPSQRQAHVADRLDAAIAFRDGLSRLIQTRVGGEFLERWRELV